MPLSARKQLKAYENLLKDNERAVALVDSAKSLVSSIDEWESDLIQPDQKTFQDVINFNNRLNAELMQLKSFIDVADPQVTQGAKDRWEDLRKEWEKFASVRDEIINVQMKQFNELYQQLKLPALIIEH